MFYFNDWNLICGSQHNVKTYALFCKANILHHQQSQFWSFIQLTDSLPNKNVYATDLGFHI